MKNVLIKSIFYCTALFFVIEASSFADKMLIPMDFEQTDHLKAYGVAYHALEQNIHVEWLLNYRSGSFLFERRQNTRQ